MQSLQGMGVAPGVAIGRAVCIVSRAVEVYRFSLAPDEVEPEVERFAEAIRHSGEEIQRVREKVGAQLGNELGAVFDAHALILNDRHFVGRISRRIRDERVNAEWAVHETAEELRQQFNEIDDAYLRERQEDLQDVSNQLLRSLQGISHHDLSEISGDVVIVADELTPGDAVRLGRGSVVGFAIESGGRTSHTTIVARSLNMPAISGLPDMRELVTDDDPMIVDGNRGLVILHPTPEVLARYRGEQEDRLAEEEALEATRDLPSQTSDGVEIDLMANIDLPEEIESALRFGAAGVGLYRSEFLYIEKSPELPTEDEHVALYRHLAEAAAPHPAIIRTYDLGGRKLSRKMLDTREENPVLGLRGVRLTLARPEVFKTQIRALYRAAAFGDLWMMIPLVTTLEEVRQFRRFTASILEELRDEGLEHRADLPFGIMIEVPAAAMIADQLAREVDFFSLGTNDLVQYALAVDRNNEHVAHLCQPLHPAILRMLRFVVDSAGEAGIPLSVCGEMAADPIAALLLVGLGLQRLSMGPRAVPEIKTRLRRHSMAELRDLAQRCSRLGTAEEIRALLEQELERPLQISLS